MCGSGRGARAEAANATLANWQDACEREGQEGAGKVIDLPEGRHQTRLYVGILSCGKTASTELDSRIQAVFSCPEFAPPEIL